MLWRAWFGWAALLLLLVLLAAVLGWAWGEEGQQALRWALTVALLVGLAASVQSWYLTLRHVHGRKGSDVLRLRQQYLCLRSLVPGVQWQTDAAHRLLHWQHSEAPQGLAAETAWSLQPGDVLAEHFCLLPQSGQPTLGQALLAHQALPATLALDERGALWRLQAQPLWDRVGHFDGHLGSARRLCPQGVLDALMEPGSSPCWLLSGSGDDAVLLHANAAALALHSDASAATGTAWRTLRERLPESLNKALQDLPSGASTWRCQRHAFSHPDLPLAGAVLLRAWRRNPQLQLQAQALQAAQMLQAEQATFSYIVSHDLRAPLRVVEGFTRIVKEDFGPQLDPLAQDHLDRVLGASARMHHMIDALLSLSQLSAQPLRSERVHLSDLAEQVLEELRRATPSRQVVCHIQPQLWVQGDPTLLRMLLENLLGNAWKYSAKCACAHISLQLQQQGEESVLVVSDDGAGFDMRFAERLFSPFQRLHSASDFPGTGVGLASVQRIVARHGGRIWAESSVGQGARFYFTLPLAPPELQSAAAPSPAV
ncbi:ATP-binding protein [Roseateles sp. BYS180W]|uniref:histidine kinase n=1 Tax=Roseateles rivi TaxID=3299028 RepID=A0ABW7FUY8_9BURK